MATAMKTQKYLNDESNVSHNTNTSLQRSVDVRMFTFSFNILNLMSLNLMNNLSKSLWLP